MGNNLLLVAKTTTGEVSRCLVGPSGREITGICWTPDLKTMFINVQHPGELGSHPNRPSGCGDNEIARDSDAFSRFPNATDATQPGARAPGHRGTGALRRGRRRERDRIEIRATWIRL